MKRDIFSMAALWAALTLTGPAAAQGVVVPTPGSAPTVAGPNSTNPSAAASGGLGATNPSAASSAVTTPNALNPSGTSSTFAPTAIGGTSRVLPRIAPPSRLVRERARARPRQARNRAERRLEAREARPARRGGKAVLLPPEVTKDRDARARRITGSVCRGC
ncbi:MAG TPA: hypothetical protein VKA39_00525 [Beijerinckiaceae bacterium]|nr:hypothetical protein [Beijerinckiaceae bacterium]